MKCCYFVVLGTYVCPNLFCHCLLLLGSVERLCEVHPTCSDCIAEREYQNCLMLHNVSHDPRLPASVCD